MDEEYLEEPFVAMFCRQQIKSENPDTPEVNEEAPSYETLMGMVEIKHELSDHIEPINGTVCDIKTEYDDSQIFPFSDSFLAEGEIKENEESQSQDKPAIVKKPRGRPKGWKKSSTKLKQERKVIRKPIRVNPNKAPSRIKSVENKTLPKMKQNVSNFRLKEEQIEEYKKTKKIFPQPGVCFRIAPKLDKCKECKKVLKKFTKNREVDCRFFQFRKLRYNEEGLEVVGFLDPYKDPIDVDRNIWQWNLEKRIKTLSPQNARFILIHVGEQLCGLIEKEESYYQKYKTDDKPVIWKRLIEGVIELCDLCSTTLFNFHFICTRCGLSLCIDCVSESEDDTFNIKCSSKDREQHLLEHLSLTQIIVGDSLNKIKEDFHEACHLWDIGHDCKYMKTTKPTSDTATRNQAKNLLYELEHGKSVGGREIPPVTATVEVDLTKVKISAQQSNPKLQENFTEYSNKFNNLYLKPEHIKPIKNINKENDEIVLSVSRTLSQAASNMIYPNIPHRWLCENKLLRLLDPMHPGNEAIFHEQWQRGQPVLISNMLDHLNQELWIPQAFSAEFGKEHSDFINCMNGKLVRSREISTFWDGFENVEKRMKDNEGKPMLLKLKDWPPDSDFKKIMPTRFEDIMKNLPLNVYTNRTGELNIVKYLPSCFIHPDLGPKGYFAYGSPFCLKEGTTNLHLDVSDAVNVMCYIGFPRDNNISIDAYVDQGFKALLEADCDIANLNRVTEDGEIPGAIWHIFQAVDAYRIRDFLLKIAQERGFVVAPNHDVIHDQNWYLDGELRARLYKEYNVKGYAIAQCLGDCIILPAGTPHQVRNIYSCIKIAEDFVSPQQVAHCLSLSNQFRKLTKTHTNNEEKLNIKNVAYHSVKEALASLQHLMWKRNMS